MRLKDTRQDERGILYRFEHVLGDDFVRNALVIRAGAAGEILSIRMNSARHGVALWEQGRGIVECNAWEDEDDVASVSWVSKHYQVGLTGKARDAAYANKIFQDCLDACGDEYLLEVLPAFCLDQQPAQFALGRYGLNPVPVRETAWPPPHVNPKPEQRPFAQTVGSGPPVSSGPHEAPPSAGPGEPVAYPGPGTPAELEHAYHDYLETHEQRRRRALLTAGIGIAGGGLAIVLVWVFILSHYFK